MYIFHYGNENNNFVHVFFWVTNENDHVFHYGNENEVFCVYYSDENNIFSVLR